MTIQSIHRVLPAVVFSLVAFTACHARAADVPRAVSPSIEIEIDDRDAGKTLHVAKLAVGFVNGHAKLKTQDVDAQYDLEAEYHAADPHIQISLRRSPRDNKVLELDVKSSIAAQAAGSARVVVARVDRADGQTTTVTAHIM
jgi:hypothetical protein